MFLFEIGAAFILDLLIGDPEYRFHPIRLIGHLILFLEKIFRRISRYQLFNGGLFAVFIISFACSLVYLLSVGAARLDHFLDWPSFPLFRFLFNVYIYYSCLSLRDLRDKAVEIKRSLETELPEITRIKLSMIVGRDTANLDQKQIVRATVETVAENIVDGILSPLFFAFIGGAPFMMAYKAANTLDSMVGYRNDRYLYFGRVSARIDDVLNFVPARLSMLFIPIAALIIRKNSFRSFKTAVKDGQKHSSPNSGIPEAAVAGALGVQLGGTNYYFGKKSEKPHIGVPIVQLKPEHIIETLIIAYGTSVLFLAVFSLFWVMVV